MSTRQTIYGGNATVPNGPKLGSGKFAPGMNTGVKRKLLITPTGVRNGAKERPQEEIPPEKKGMLSRIISWWK